MGIPVRRFGRAGWELSVFGFGGWAIGSGWGAQDDGESLKALHRALDLGVTFMDTAQAYGEGRSERLIGRALKERGVRPGEVRVATKIPPLMERGMVWPPLPEDRAGERYPADYLRRAVESSLKNLGVEALDLVQLHTWTRAWNADPTPLLELRRLKGEGKLLALGISTPEQDQNSVLGPVKDGLVDSVQVIYNIFEREPEAELLPAAKAQDIAVIVRCALDEGSLTGKFTRDTRFGEGDFRAHHFRGDRLAETVERVEALRADLAAAGEADPASAALRFPLAHDAVSVVIPGMRRPSQVERNLAAAGLGPLSGEALAAARRHIWRHCYWHS